MHVATDLHGHTLFSDGRATPEAYVDFRRVIGLRVISISDHDVLASTRRGAAAARAGGMVYLPAVEVTSFFAYGTKEAEEVHVLAYYPSAVLLEGRLERTYFYRRGVRLQQKWREHVLAWLAGRSPADRARIDPDLALERLPAAIFPAIQSMIDRIATLHAPLLDGFRAHAETFAAREPELFAWTPEEAIEAIRADGAIDVVAHPGRYRDHTRTARLLAHATGVEVYTCHHPPDLAAHFRVLAEERAQLWTASADDHQSGRYVYPPVGTPAATVERLLGTALPMGLVVAA
jgi:3',5'-nucleoside bisphosphate phosphatase